MYAVVSRVFLINIALAGFAIVTVVATGRSVRIAAFGCGVMLVAAFLAWLSQEKTKQEKR